MFFKTVNEVLDYDNYQVSHESHFITLMSSGSKKEEKQTRNSEVTTEGAEISARCEQM